MSDDTNAAMVLLQVARRAETWTRRLRKKDPVKWMRAAWWSSAKNMDFRVTPSQEFHFPKNFSDETLDDPMWDVLTPLAHALGNQNSVAWCAASFRRWASPASRMSGNEPSLYFRYWMQDRVLSSPDWRTQALAGLLAARMSEKPFEILLASDICLNSLDDGTPLILQRHCSESSKGWSVTPWVVTAPEIFRRLAGIQPQLNELFRKAWVDETARRESLVKIDQLIHGKIHDIGPEAIVSLSPNAGELHPLRVALLRGAPVGLALCKYLALMTCVWPDWQRITMLPHAASLGKVIQPGGLLICEDGPPDCHLSAIELKDASLISSTAFAQYQITLADERALIESRDRTIGLVHHEISRGIGTVKGMLEPSESSIAMATQALERMALITRASFNLTAGLPDPMLEGEFVLFVQQDISALRAQRRMRVAPVVVATIDDDLIDVDSRLYVIAREVLRNAGKHITSCPQLRSPHEPGMITFDAQTHPSGMALSCRSSPHHLPIEDPALYFRENPDNPSMKGLGLIRLLAEQLGGEIAWIPERIDGPKFLVGDKMHGGYSVCFTYTGPRLIKRRQ